ncbi:glycosyltransferase [Emticicia sp. 21SJ11W-3]|uniref:glycosyltransferase family 2 protein n=1 Tax=Emticicia sp. 21SJ11W-3 TaxID=2916755 RepID=UPI00209FA677|nr:glycosyltransferase [Emticicia sp. 21SJ11W-3]UTA69429.1 glycosyltransferase [Emticicia sp. 21SJ11W-3]
MAVVSVLMPVFNAEKYVKEAINSILNQTLKDFELIILNDSSTDNSKDVVLSIQDNRIRYIENESNQGLAFSRNRLLSEAKSKYIAWLDADDIAYPTRLQDEVDFLEANPGHAMVSGWARLIDSDGHATGDFIKSYIPDKHLGTLLLFVNYFVQSGMMLRREYLPEVHYRPEYPPAEDYELWVRIAASHAVAILPKILVDYRIHATNTSSTQQERSEKGIKMNHRHQLSELGINATQEEIDLHYSIAFKKAESIEYLRKASVWLQGIKAQNKISGRFDATSLAYILSHRWIKVCTSNKALGMQALKIYFKSPLVQLSLRNIFLILQYCIKN